MDMEIVTTSGVSATEVPADVAEDLTAAYEKLSGLPVNRAVAVTFSDAKAARAFVRQGKAWASAQRVTVDVTDEDGEVTGQYVSPLAFARKGDIKGEPTKVTFRIYIPRKSEVLEDAETE